MTHAAHRLSRPRQRLRARPDARSPHRPVADLRDARPGLPLRRGRAHRLRPAQSRREHPLRRPGARADQQPDHPAAERGTDADEPGPQPCEPALFLAAGAAAECRPDPAASDPGAEHRLRCRPNRPGLPAGLRQFPHGRARGAASGRCPLPLGKHRRRPAGRAARPSRRRRQSRRPAHRALRPCRRKPIRRRCPAGDPGGQPAPWRCNPSRSPT